MKDNTLSFTSKFISGEGAGAIGVIGIIAVVAMICLTLIAGSAARQGKKKKR